MYTEPPSALGAVCLALITILAIKWYRLRASMPPGPRGIPWIGNRHQLPSVKPWRKFAEWNRQYGNVMSFFLGTTPVVVLGTAQAAWDLLEKRSEIYSSRPRSIVAGEILSDNMRGLMLPNNEAWRRWRKVLHSGFHARKAASYREIQSLESSVTMMQLLKDPVNYERHLQRYAASVVTSVTYGRRVDSVDEWVVKENMNAMDFHNSQIRINLKPSSIPGKYIVESWPWLLKLPRSLQWFRRAPEAQRQRDIAFLTHLVDGVKKGMKDGTVPDCLTSQTISEIDKIGMSEIEMAYAVSSPFGAGIETVCFRNISFILQLMLYTRLREHLAMLHFPEVMKKAQAELDANVGFDRIPEFEDKDSLPYVNALIDETLSVGWCTHAVTVDDEYGGIRAVLEANHPAHAALRLPFGFGRRICPGMHLALNSLFINIARILWAFDISPETGASGAPLLPGTLTSIFTNGFNSRPAPFKCRLVPRNEKVVGAIEQSWQAVQPRLDAWR
ncbi:cytochrome P450 [Infundibulicybe gibba]|nr:cytochrome P450 [Infundibulicybe gibba]